MAELIEAPVVTCFLRHRGRVLLVRRSQKVGSYRGQWGGVAGYVEGEDAEASAWREIAEETGLETGLELVRAGDSFRLEDHALGKCFVVHPFLFDTESRDIRLDWESDEADWVEPTEILRRRVVPRLWTSYERVAATPASIRDDRRHGSVWLSLRALEILRDRSAVLAHEDADETASWRELRELAESLLQIRASMAAVQNRVHRVMHRAKRNRVPSRAVEVEASRAIQRACDADDEAARGASRLVSGRRVLTLSRSETVTAALVAAKPPPEVTVAESRPGLEGVAVAENLAARGLKVTLITDAAMSAVLETQNLECVVTGADALLPSGDVVNKVGTRLAALAARERELPFYAVTATDKVSVHPSLELESLPAKELYDGEAPLRVLNPLFERIPADLVTGIVTERGLLRPDAMSSIAEELAALDDWRR